MEQLTGVLPRRRFLWRAGLVSLLSSLSARPLVSAAAKTGGNDKKGRIYEELGLRPFINAAGTYTMYSASLMPPEVTSAMHEASLNYVSISELQEAVGKRIASLVGSESALVTSGAGSCTEPSDSIDTGSNNESSAATLRTESHGVRSRGFRVQTFCAAGVVLSELTHEHSATEPAEPSCPRTRLRSGTLPALTGGQTSSTRELLAGEPRNNSASPFPTTRTRGSSSTTATPPSTRRSVGRSRPSVSRPSARHLARP